MPIKPSHARVRRNLLRLYEKLRAHYGTPKFWSDEPKWEIMVGAILTQNTSWTNVDMALESLKRANALNPVRISEIELGELEGLIRSAGFTTSKPKRLKALAEFLRACLTIRDYDALHETETVSH